MQKKSTFPQDGAPTGPNTPEGAACDMVRALMYHDRARLLEICLPPQRTSSLGTYIKVTVQASWNDGITTGPVKTERRHDNSSKPCLPQVRT